MIMKRIAVICFCLYVLYFLTFMISVKREKSDAFPGVPEELSKKENYLCEISDFCVNDGLIYLLFDDKGVIQIFDEKGIYQKSFAFLLQKKKICDFPNSPLKWREMFKRFF